MPYPKPYGDELTIRPKPKTHVYKTTHDQSTNPTFIRLPVTKAQTHVYKTTHNLNGVPAPYPQL